MLNVILNLKETENGNIFYLFVETNNTVKNFLLGEEKTVKSHILNLNKRDLSKKSVRKKIGKEILRSFGVEFEDEIDLLDTMTFYLP